MSKWISVKDGLPDNNNETLLITDGTDVFAGFYCSMLEWHMSNGESCDDIGFDVFYWMYLPEPPK